MAGFDPAMVSARKPAMFTCVLDNYKEIMRGNILDQWQDAFRQDTNTSLILYVIVFLVNVSTADLWEIDGISIKFGPLSEAFNKLFFISYIKTLFDETYAGEPVTVPATPGTTALVSSRFTNSTGGAVTVPAGTYTLNNGVKSYLYTLAADLMLATGEAFDVECEVGSLGACPLGAGQYRPAHFRGVVCPAERFGAVCRKQAVAAPASRRAR